MLNIEGADQRPLKFFPPRQVIGPRPPVPPTPNANFFTLGRTMTQSAFASTSAGTSLLASIACNTVVALPRVSSSLPLSAAHTGNVEKIRSRDVSKQSMAFLVCCIAIQPPFLRTAQQAAWQRQR